MLESVFIHVRSRNNKVKQKLRHYFEWGQFEFHVLYAGFQLS
jgi:hypothetical protein